MSQVGLKDRIMFAVGSGIGGSIIGATLSVAAIGAMPFIPLLAVGKTALAFAAVTAPLALFAPSTVIRGEAERLSPQLPTSPRQP